MGLLDVLFGRKRLPRAKLDKLFALSTARVTLEVELGLRQGGAAAVVYKPLSVSDFSRADDDVRELLHAAAKETGTDVERRSDAYGFEWVVVRDRDFEDLVTCVHLVSSEMQAKGFGEQLLAAAFRFDDRDRPVYLIYGYKRGTFWPFVPSGEEKEKERDNPFELKLKNELERELPIEPDLSRWLGLFGAPL